MKNTNDVTKESLSLTAKKYGRKSWNITDQVATKMFELYQQRFESSTISLLDLEELYNDATKRDVKQEMIDERIKCPHCGKPYFKKDGSSYKQMCKWHISNATSHLITESLKELDQ